MDTTKDDYLISSAEYRQRLSKMRRNVYLHGKLTGRDNAEFEGGKEIIGLTYDLAFNSHWEKMLTATSSISGRKINRYCHVFQSADDMLKKLKVTRLFIHYTGRCIQRCMGADALNGLSVATYNIDKRCGTEYYKRFLKYLDYFEKNCLVASVAMTDVKGNRSLRPHEQPDPDVYLRIVERKSDGIVVRGCKAHNTITPYADEILVMPTRRLTEDERDWAVAFAIPADWEGIKIIATPREGKGLVHKQMEGPIDRYGISDSVTVFDNVFIPWDRVFLCGEWDYAHNLAMGFARCHRQSYCGCKAGLADVMLGAASLIAKYNGVRSAGHIRAKLNELVVDAELVYACGIASAINGERFENGVYLPDELYSNIGRLYSTDRAFRWIHILVEIAGGMAENLVSEDQYLSEEVGPYLKKYYVGDNKYSVDDRYRLFRYIQELSHGTHFSIGGDIHGGGAPEMYRLAVERNTEFEYYEELVKRFTGISDEKYVPAIGRFGKWG